LRSIYKQITIPLAVYRELQAPKAPQEVKEWVDSLPNWVFVADSDFQPDVSLIHLDEGERQAIALCEKMAASALIIDERDGREEAVRRGIFVVGTLGILRAAAEQDLIDLPDAFDKLKQTSFRVSDELLHSLLQRDAARRAR
jgi:predicted nucleic acid-binding protein